MKVFNSTLAAIGLAAFVFTSCSDNTSDPTGGDGVKSEVNSVELTALTPSSVINYKNSTAMARKFFATRGASATDFVTAMPNFPTKPQLIKELTKATDLVLMRAIQQTLTLSRTRTSLTLLTTRFRV